MANQPTPKPTPTPTPPVVVPPTSAPQPTPPIVEPATPRRIADPDDGDKRDNPRD